MPRRRHLLALALAAFASAAAHASEAPWLVGYWLDCSGRAPVAESWIDGGSDTLLGVSLTRGRTRTAFEFMRIAKAADGATTFYGSPNAAPPTPFQRLRAEGLSITFENLGHDFPQRVVYRREGEILHARVEGVVDGKVVGQDWTYRAAAPNAACPAP